MDKITKGWRMVFLIGVLFISCGFAFFSYGMETLLREPEKHTAVVVAVDDKTITLIPLIVKLQPKIEPLVAEHISINVLKYSKMYDLPPELVLSVINEESRFRILSTSKKGAAGLMQIMHKPHSEKLEKLGISRIELYHISHNIHIGCWVLREYYDKTKSVEKALYRYVGGNTKNSSKYVNNILINLATILIEDQL